MTRNSSKPIVMNDPASPTFDPTKPTVTPPIETGIYRIPGTISASVETHTEEAFAIVIEKINASWHCPTLDEELRRIIGNARKADPRKNVQEAAGDVLTAIYRLNMVLATGDVRAAAARGIEVGTLDEQLRIKLAHEEKALTGSKFIKASEKGTENLTRETHARYIEINAWIAEKMKVRCKVSLTQRRHQAADEFGVSLDTVLAAQSWERNGGKKSAKNSGRKPPVSI